MAKVEFTAWVRPWKVDKVTKEAIGTHPNWAIKTAESHRKEIDGVWQTVGQTFRTVKAGFGREIDFTSFKDGDRVLVIGNEMTETSEYNGVKYYDLIVKADSVTLFDPMGVASVPSIDDSTPF